MNNLIEGKSLEEIKELRDEIIAQQQTEEGMDEDYWNAFLTLIRLATFKEILRTEQERFMKNRNIEKQRQEEEARRRALNQKQRRIITEDEAVEREFSPEAIAPSAVVSETVITVMTDQDDLNQLAKEREMVHHRELEILTYKLMDKKHHKNSNSYRGRIFDQEVE